MRLQWTVVMGTGIISVTLALAHEDTISWILLALAGAAWIVLLVNASRALASRGRGRLTTAGETSALAAVPASAVLGSRLLIGGATGVAAALLVLAAAMWVALTGRQVGHARLPRTGAVFMVAVAPYSLAVLAAALGGARGRSWLAVIAFALCLLGIALYLVALARFDLAELRTGRGEHWVAGGAVAICALALAEISLAVPGSALSSAAPVLHTAAVVSWAVGIVWLVVLVAFELAAPRLGYDAHRWSTVFPVGMYGAASFETGRAANLSALVNFADVWAWVGVAVWLAVSLGALRTASSSRGRAPATPA